MNIKKNLLLFFVLIITVGVYSQEVIYEGTGNGKGNRYSNFLPPQKNGDGALGNSYNRTACGLNYAVGSWQVSKRSSTVGTPPGLGMPATFNFSQLPNSTCYGVDTAFLWWIVSDYQQVCFYDEDTAYNYCANPTYMFDADFNEVWCCPATADPFVSITNPDKITYSDTGRAIGQGGSKNWYELFTRTYRMGIPKSVITGNGTYTLNIKGQDDYGIDGFILMVIYRDPTATWQGNLIIDDGCFTRSVDDTTCGLATYDSIAGFNACANSINANAFLLVSDLQRNVQPTFQAILNGKTVTDSANFFNFVTTSTTVSKGQTVSNFGVIPDTTDMDCYTLAVTGLYYQTNSCTTCIPDTATVPLQLVTNFTNDSCNKCKGQAIITASGGNPPYTYQWSASAGNQTDSVATGLCVGTHSVTVTDASTCTQQKDTSVIITSIGDVTSSKTAKDATCYNSCDGNATVTPSGGTIPYTYKWNSAAKQQTTQTATSLCAGNYTLTVTDKNGCTKKDTITIKAPSAITIKKTSTSASCGNADGTATVIITGGSPSYSYVWANAQTNATATGLIAGTYAVTVTDSKGCTASDKVAVNNIGAPVISASATAATCNGKNDGKAVVTAVGGTPPYSYVWDSTLANQTDTAISGLAAGTYSVTLTDAINCIATEVITINQPPAIQLSVSSTNESCTVGNDGTVTITASNGISPYAYQWDANAGNQTNASLTGLSAGTYVFTVTDKSNCSVSDSITIKGTGMPDADFTLQPDNGYIPLVVQFSDKSVVDNDVIVSWQWNFGDGNSANIPSPSNIYNTVGSFEVSLIITSSIGCIDTAIYQYVITKAESDLFVPNVFSPNTDGMNDLFTTVSKGIVSFLCVVFDRWGIKMYEWDDAQKGWDGKHKGKEVPDGTYYYIINAEGIDKVIYNKSGVITLVR